MGASRGEFHKYPRTPHLFGSKGTDDDKHLGEFDSAEFLNDPTLIVEEKLDGTNVGIHLAGDGRLVLQCRGHEITSGMHPQYDLFKQWTVANRHTFENILQDRYILFGEWLYAKHSILYRQLPHYFFEFDIFDKETESFLTLADRLKKLEGTGIHTVPVVHQGTISSKELLKLIGPSRFDSVFDNPYTTHPDNIMEGLYLRTEADGRVSRRGKVVRPEFIEKIKQSEHWQHQAMIPNELQNPGGFWS